MSAKFAVVFPEGQHAGHFTVDYDEGVAQWVGRSADGGTWSRAVAFRSVVRAAKSRFGQSVEVVQTDVPMCVDDFVKVHGFEPDMGMEGVTFQPGVCTKCGAEAIVFEAVA